LQTHKAPESRELAEFVKRSHAYSIMGDRHPPKIRRGDIESA
jgi:hypothetical protein